MLMQARPDWQQRAACAAADPDLFFPTVGCDGTIARRYCATCTVRAECLDYALANCERFGIWGGLSEKQRRTIKRVTG